MNKNNQIFTFKNILQTKLFHKHPILIQLNFFFPYMFLFTPYNYLKIIPLYLTKNNKYLEITIGTPTHDLIYINVFKDIINSKITKFFYNKYIIALNIMPLF